MSMGASMTRDDLIAVAGVVISIVVGAFLSLCAAVEILSRW